MLAGALALSVQRALRLPVPASPGNDSTPERGKQTALPGQQRLCGVRRLEKARTAAELGLVKGSGPVDLLAAGSFCVWPQALGLQLCSACKHIRGLYAYGLHAFPYEGQTRSKSHKIHYFHCYCCKRGPRGARATLRELLKALTKRFKR